MQEEIRKLTNEFVCNLVRVLTSGKVEDLGAVHREVAGTPKKKRGLGALPFEQRSIIARKAAATRKHRAAGRKAAITRKKNAAV